MLILLLLLSCSTISTIHLIVAAAPPSFITTTLPFDTLANSNCSVPTVCGQVKGAQVQCRCDDIITVCYNDQRQYCWGSTTLHQTTGCPSMPDACASRFNSTVSCLCNASNVLCVDQYSRACYGSIQGSNVSLLPLGGLAPPSSSPSVSSPSTLPSSTSTGTQFKGTLAATSTPIPNHSTPLSSPFLLSLILPLLFIITFSIL